MESDIINVFFYFMCDVFIKYIIYIYISNIEEEYYKIFDFSGSKKNKYKYKEKIGFS